MSFSAGDDFELYPGKADSQLPTRTPQFVFFANLPQYVKEPYKRFIENQLRQNFNFSGVPIEIYFR